MSPEEFFLREAARPFVRDFEPRKYLAAAITHGKSVSRRRRKRRVIIPIRRFTDSRSALGV